MMIQKPKRTMEEMFTIPSTIEFVDGLEEIVNIMSIYTRRLDFYPFDTVAGELISKCFALARSAILLIQNGYPDEAFGLCRSLYESSIYLRYITRDREQQGVRANKFLEFGHSSKAFWMDLLTKSNLSDAEREDVSRYKDEFQIPDDLKRITQPWSEVRRFIETFSKLDHPADSLYSTETFRLQEKAISYTDASSYVHCTQPGINSYSYAWTEPIITKNTRNGQNGTAHKACMSIQTNLRAVVRYCLFGLGLASASELQNRQHPASDLAAEDEPAEIG